MSKKLNIGIVGLGHWGKNYLRIFENLNKQVIIKKICEIKVDSQFKLRKNFTSNYNNLIKDENIAAIVISTDASTHFNLAKKALIAKKHVLVEKPITLNVNQAKILNKLSKKNKVNLMVGHTFLYNEAIRKIKKIIKRNILGKIYYINCKRTHLGLVRNDVNAIWDLATHDISIINYILNKNPVSGNYQQFFYLNKNRSDTAFLHIKYPNKIIANIHVSWLDTNKSRIIEIICSKAKVVFDDMNILEPIKIYKKGISLEKNIRENNNYLNLRDGDIISPKIYIKEPLYEMCLDFINSIKKKKEPLSNFKIGYNSIKILEQMKLIS